MKTYLREVLEGYHIRLINIRNQKSFSDTSCYEIIYEANFIDPQIENIMRELEHLCPTVDFEFDLTSYDLQRVAKVVRNHIRIRFRHRALIMATQLECSVEH